MCSSCIKPHYAADGRLQMFVGTNAVASHATIIPVSVYPMPACVTEAEPEGWWASHYQRITILMDCALPAGMSRPPMFQLHIDGAETRVDPEYARTGIPDDYDIRGAEEGEYVMPISPLLGYIAISGFITHNNLLASVRFIAKSDHALLKTMNCLAVWEESSDGYKVSRGSCYGFGHYKSVLFDAWFQLKPGHREQELSDSIRYVIDDMIAQRR